jgi:hypothetical protein
MTCCRAKVTVTFIECISLYSSELRTKCVSPLIFFQCILLCVQVYSNFLYVSHVFHLIFVDLMGVNLKYDKRA